jgi:hypothetical protein
VSARDWTPVDFLIIGGIVAILAWGSCSGPDPTPYGPEDCTVVYYNSGPECE